MEGFLPVFFLIVVLKIPVIGMLYLLWWASKPPVEADGVQDEGEGGSHDRWIPKPKFPRGPRRDPHGGGAAKLPRPARGTRALPAGMGPVAQPTGEQDPCLEPAARSDHELAR